MAAWKKANPEKVAADHAAYYLANKEAVLARGAKWRESNKEKIRGYAKVYAITARIKTAAWRAANREKSRELSRLKEARRRARKASAPGGYTAEGVRALIAGQRGRCVYCPADVRIKFHIDHIMPLSMGGSDKPSNIQILCPPCNRRKWAKHPIDFAQQMGMLL